MVIKKEVHEILQTKLRFPLKINISHAPNLESHLQNISMNRISTSLNFILKILFRFQCTTNVSRTYIQASELGLA